MPEKDTITVSEWKTALAELECIHTEAPDGYLTVREICAETGHNDRVIKDLLRRANNHGKLQVVKTPRMDLSGRFQMIPAYRIKLTKGKR